MRINESETSIAVYHKNKESFICREEQAYQTLVEHGPMTANELFDKIKHTFPTENYRHNTQARLSALRSRGLATDKDIPKRTCEINGETISVWSLVPSGKEAVYRKAALTKQLDYARKLVIRLEKEIESCE